MPQPIYEHWYTLDADRKPRRCTSAEEWEAAMRDEAARQVAFDKVGAVEISTVFLGLDQSLGRRGGPPVVFETMVFNAPSAYVERYTTWADAEAGHAAVVTGFRRLDALAARSIPIVPIEARKNDPTVYDEANARMQKVNDRLRPHKARLEAFGTQALRAKNAAAKVKALRSMLDLVNDAAYGQAACAKGCSACCHISVMVCADEAAVIAAEIGTKAAKPARYAVHGDNARATLKHYGEPCPFLVDGACGIYESRPLSCRTAFNMDRDALLCTIVPNDPPQVPYLNHMQFTMVIARAFLDSMHKYADLRDFFPECRKK